jgi:protein-tyrosine phosphatase
MDYYNGVVKVKDGLFMGNCETGEDLEFITDNKITRVINCAGFELTNLFESSGVKYLTFDWLDNEGQQIFDAEDSVIKKVTSFIDDSLEKGESCLVWSVNGCSRSACVICGYLMNKFSWTLYKALEYLTSKLQSLCLCPSFLHQLFSLQERLLNDHQKSLTCTWEVQNGEVDDLLLQNTFLNSKSPQVSMPPRPLKNSGALTWSERLLKGKENKQDGPILVKSCLKGNTENSFVYNPSRGSSAEVSFRSDGESRKGLLKKQEFPLKTLKNSKNSLDFLLKKKENTKASSERENILKSSERSIKERENSSRSLEKPTKSRENSTKSLERPTKERENSIKPSERPTKEKENSIKSSKLSSSSNPKPISTRVKTFRNPIKILRDPKESLKTQTLKDVSSLLNTGGLNQSSKAVKTLKSVNSRTVRTPSPIVFSDPVLQQNRLRRPWR